MVEAYLEDCALLETQIVVSKQARDRTDPCASPGSDSGTLASALCCAGGSANSSAYRDGFNLMLLAHALALQLAFFAGIFDGVISRNTCDGCDQRHRAVTSIDFVKAQHHARMEALLDSTDVAFDGFAARNHCTVAGDQILSELGLEMFPLLQVVGVEFVVQPDQEACAFWNCVRRRLRSDSGILGEQESGTEHSK